MYLIRANAHFRAETKPHPVRHPGAGIPEHAGAVDGGLEGLGYWFRGGEDGVGVVGAVGVDMGDGEGEGEVWGGGDDGLDGEDGGEEFGVVVGVCGVL